MNANDKIRFATVLMGVAEYYGKPLSEGVVELYWQGLREFDFEAVSKAFWDHTQNPDSGQFMPKIADIVRILQGRTSDQATVAWTKVDNAVRRVGTYHDVVFDDPIIHRVIADMGGWIAMGQKNDDEWPFVQREFENRYRGYRIRNETPEYQSRLIGISNAYNQKEGFKLQKPMLIGDERKAQQVLLGGSVNAPIAIKMASEVMPAVKQIRAA